jgi:GNAT superfamily N-acetyltransferase
MTQPDKIDFEETSREGLKALFGERAAGFRFLDISGPQNPNSHFIVMRKNDTPAAYAHYCTTPWNECLEAIEVHPDHRGEKLGRLMQEEVFRRAAESPSRTLVVTHWTEDGKKHLLPHTKDLEKQYPGLDFVLSQMC